MTGITQQHLDTFKSLHPNNEKIQSVTLAELHKNTAGTVVDWNSLALDKPALQAQAVEITDCQKAIGFVVFDVVILTVGGLGLRATVKPQTIEAMAIATAPVLSKIEVAVAKMAAQGASKTDIAKGIFSILSTIYSGGCLGAVVSAFTSSLSWWDALLYGVTATATIVAALATDGIAYVAEIVILLASAGFVASDSVKAVQACSITPAPTPTPTPTPTPGPNPFPFEPTMAIGTVNGHTLTIVNNGGLGGGNVAIQTDRRAVGPWETFTIIPIDQNLKTFALKTCNGNYVTAVNGGGMGGPNDASSPVHTDATWTRIWETLIFEELADGNYAICTPTGYYLTAVNGGGFGGPNTQPIHTDATAIGPWETFTLLKITNS
jgi:hypothetical protein